MAQYFKIGKLVATFGLKGELVLQHSLGKKTSLKGLQVIFVEDKKDSFLPYFIQSAKIKNETEVFLQTEGIETKESAKKLVSKNVWLSEDDFKKFAAASSPIALLGFSLVNEDENLGEITEVIEQPHQLLCTIILSGKEALIPIHEESLKKIDKKKRIIYVNLPEGLLDIYK